MNKLFLLLSSTALISACTKVPAGNVGVKFDLYGGSKGVTGEVVGPGRYWLGINEELYLFPTFSQNYVWTAGEDRESPTDQSITFQDKEGTQINADIGITYAVRGDKAHQVFQKYRRGIDEITNIYIRNMVRDALNSETSKMDVSDIYGVGKEELMIRVTKRVQDQVKDIGIIVEKIYWTGAMRLPPAITAAINNKIEATQKAQQRENELQTARAQAEIARETARGEADAKITIAKGDASKVLPFRFIAASRACPQLEPELDKKLLGLIEELPNLNGTTIVLVDVSGSMNDPLSSKSDLTRMDSAAALASIVRSDDLRVFTFSSSLVEVPPRRGMAGVDSVIKSQYHGSTDLVRALNKINEIEHDRLIVITDEQHNGERIPKSLAKVASYMINVGAYQNGIGYRNGWTHLDGFSENVLRYIHEIENV